MRALRHQWAQADDGFLEAVLQFVVALPLADVWQDAAWREQQRRLLTAQFGPREVAALGAAAHSALGAVAADAGAAGSSPARLGAGAPCFLTLPPELAALGAAAHSALGAMAAHAGAAGSSPLAWVQARPAAWAC